MRFAAIHLAYLDNSERPLATEYLPGSFKDWPDLGNIDSVGHYMNGKDIPDNDNDGDIDANDFNAIATSNDYSISTIILANQKRL